MIDINTYLTDILTAPNIDTQIANYVGRYPNMFPQMNMWGGPNKTTRRNLENQNRLDIRWLDEHEITRRIEPWKSVTTWYLAVLMFDGIIPVGILRNTDSREDMFADLLLINKTQHHYASAYMFSFLEADPGPELEIYDTIGTFSGDVQPHIRGINSKYYDVITDGDYLTRVLDYTVTYNY